MIVENLVPESSFVRSPMSNGIIRMSLVDNCPRQQGYIAMGYEQDYPETGRSQIAADDGNLHEADIVERLLNAGYRCWNYGSDQTSTHLEAGGLRFRGHPDLFAETPEGVIVGLEVKGYRDEIFRNFVEGSVQPFPGVHHVTNMAKLMKRPYPLMGQLQMYLNSDVSANYGIDNWVLIMKNKNTAELAECIVPKDPVYMDTLIKKWTGFWGLTQAGRLPERFFSDDSIECRRCLFRKKCWNLGEISHTGRDVLYVEGLEKAAELRREGTSLKKDADYMLEEARMAFLTEHIRNEVDRIECDDLMSVVSDRSRKGLNSGEVNKVLAHMLEKGNIDYQQYEDCFSESNYQEVRFRDKRPS